MIGVGVVRFSKLAVLALLVGACTGALAGVPNDDASDSDIQEGSSTTTADTDIARPAPTILDATEQTTPNALLYVLIDAPLSAVDVSIADMPLEAEVFLQTDTPGALYRVPEDVPLGDGALRVAWREAPESFDERTIEVVPPAFEDVAPQLGLDVVHDATGSPIECAESHTGLAWGDYDDDERPDVFFGNVGSGGTLHRAIGDGFVETTEQLGLGGIDSVSMATFVDLEGDGDQDLFIGRRGTNRVFRNRLVEDGQASFEDITAQLGLGSESQRTMGVAFGDYDGDDDLDLYVVNHAFCFPQRGSEVRATDHLYENVDGVFVDRTEFLDAALLDSVGFSASWLDTDRDGDLDLVVINDAVGGAIGFPNGHWRNDGPDGDGHWRFVEVGTQTGLAQTRVNGMGLAYGDLNHDGFVDLAFTNIGPNRLLLSRADGTWDDASVDAGIERSRLPWARESITWAVHLPDIDNDGDLDLYVSGGRIKGSAPVVDALFVNRGNAVFDERTWSSGLVDPAHGKASALVDFDRDGGLDIVTTAWGDRARVYRNLEGAQNHWLQVELRQPGSNRDALGAIVELSFGGELRTCFHSNRPSLGGGSDAACHFGLGDAERIDALRVHWPDGTTEAFDHGVIVDRRIRLTRTAP